VGDVHDVVPMAVAALDDDDDDDGWPSGWPPGAGTWMNWTARNGIDGASSPDGDVSPDGSFAFVFCSIWEKGVSRQPIPTGRNKVRQGGRLKVIETE
jgi:hypothetical protein